MLLDGWRELRVDDVGATWRIVDRVDIDAIVILDVFKKKSYKTPREVIAACKLRITSYDEVD